MVDEAHERSISTDILLGLPKKIQKHRPELCLIISSATIEAKSMSNFFQSSKRRRVLEGEELKPSLEPAILSVEGRGFNVQIHYIEDPVQDYVQAAVSTVLLIHDQEAPGDILVFLTGQDDVDVAVKLLTEGARSNGKNSSGLIIPPLYSGLSHAEQDLVFSPTPKGKRKVVISTNIAETSLTLEGVVYVVDNGFSKQRFYNPEQMISKMILAANELGCSEQIITIAAVLSIQSIWFSGRGAQKDLDEAKLRFAAAEGDHVTFPEYLQRISPVRQIFKVVS